MSSGLARRGSVSNRALTNRRSSVSHSLLQGQGSTGIQKMQSRTSMTHGNNLGRSPSAQSYGGVNPASQKYQNRGFKYRQALK